MALSFDKAGNNTAINSATTTVNLAAAGANEIAIIGVTYAGGPGGVTDDFSSMTVGGTNATAIGTVINQIGTGTRYMRFFYFLNPPTSSTAYTLTETSPSASQEGNVAVSLYAGASQSGVPDSSNTGSALAAGTLTLTTTVVASNCWLVSFVSGDGGTMTASTGTTARATTGDGQAIGDSNATVGTGSQSMSWTDSLSRISNGFIVSIAPSGGGGGPALPFKTLMGVGM